MNDQRFQTAGWLVFVKMGVNVLMLGLMIFILAAGKRAVGLVAFRGFILILSGVLSAYILLTLRRLLWDRYDFHQLDIMLPVLACADVVLEILNQASEIFQAMHPGDLAPVLLFRILAVVIPWGILVIIFAAGLLKLPFSERSLLKPYAYLNLAAGIVLVSMILVLASPIFGLILFPVLALTGLASDVLLGLTFLRSRETEQVEFV